MTVIITIPQSRIEDILKERREIARKIKSYGTRRDFLQLCAEVERLRQYEPYQVDVTPFDSSEVAGLAPAEVDG